MWRAASSFKNTPKKLLKLNQSLSYFLAEIGERLKECVFYFLLIVPFSYIKGRLLKSFIEISLERIMTNIQNDLEGYNYYLDKILPSVNLWRVAYDKLLIMDIKWLNLSLSKQPGLVWEIDGRKTDVWMCMCRYIDI